MKIFVTGSCGFVGQKLVRKLVGLGHQVVAVDASKSSLSGHIQADIRASSIAEVIPEEADAIIHLAGLTRDADCRNRAYECFDVNVMATLNLMNAAALRKVKQFIFASSEWVYDSFAAQEVKTEETPIDITKLDSEYALSKLVSEQNLRQRYKHGFCDVTILRFGIIYGPRPANWSAVESLFNAVKANDLVSVGSLKTGRCFIHVDDIVQGIIASIGLQGFNTINLQGQRLITLGDIIEASKKIHGRRPAVEEKSPDNFNVRPVKSTRSSALLKWSAGISLEQGLQTLLDQQA